MQISPIHYLSISTDDGERTFDYACPDDCTGGDYCAKIGQFKDRLFELTDDLPDGEYRFSTRTLWTHDLSITMTLPTGEIIPALTGAPSGCQRCGIPEREHGRQYLDGVGTHSWQQPTMAQIKLRMRARRLLAS